MKLSFLQSALLTITNKNLLVLNLSISLILLGIILITQLVNYPLFIQVKSKDFKNFHNFYVSRISYCVGPVILIELLIAIILLLSFNTILYSINFGLVILFLLSTILIQVPIHNQINNFYNIFLISKLIKTNMIRTFLCIIKCILSYTILIKEII